MKKIAPVVLGLILTLTFAPTSWGHAELKSSNPVKGSTLEVMPATISATFNEALMILGDEQVNTLALRDPYNEDISLSEVSISGDTISAAVRLESALLSGEYRIIYRVVSADGHPIEGDVPFIYAPADQATAMDEPQPTDESSPDAQPVSESNDGLNNEVISGVVALILLVGLLFWLRKRN